MTPQFSLATIYVTNVGKNNRDRPVTVCNLQEVLQGMVDHEIACHQRFSSNLYRIVTDETSLVSILAFTHLDDTPELPDRFSLGVDLRLVKFTRQLEHRDLGWAIL